MSNFLGKLAEKIGVVVQPGGTLNIENFYHQNHQQPKRPRNEQILIKQVRNEVYSRLKQSLHGQFITLDKESQPQKVQRIWDADIKIGIKEIESLPKETTILDVFNQADIGGRFLILGQPGAGKTTTQLDLAKGLIEKYVDNDPEYPIPVLLNLSSYREGTIHDWIVEELKSKYGIRKDIAAQWLNGKKLLLLLDSLDELKTELQVSCAEMLNQYLAGEQASEYTIICCRLEEYGLLKNKLQLNGAIRLKPLTEEQIQNYLIGIKQEELWAVASNDTQLLKLIQTPLMLSVTALAHQEVSPEEWQRNESNEDRRQILWDGYLRRMMNPSSGSRIYRNSLISTREQTRKWLIWLAKHLEQEGQSEFLIEKMQPSCLQDRNQMRLYRTIVLIIFSIEITALCCTFNWFVLASELVQSDSMSERFSYIFGIIMGPLGGMMFIKQNPKIKPFEVFRWSWQEAKNKFIFELRRGQSLTESSISLFVLFGIFFGLFGGVRGIILGIFSGVIIGFILPFCFYIPLGIFGGLNTGFTGIYDGERMVPNQGIWWSLKNSVIVSLITLIILSLYITLLMAFIPHVDFQPLDILVVFIVGTSLSVGLSDRGACTQHFILRFILYYNRQIPWNYARFLDYCTERLLLQRVGGRYRFIHKQLQEHFAAMTLEKS